MEFLTIPGESCFTSADAKKLKKAINNSDPGALVTKVRGYWVHYVHFKTGDASALKVRFAPFCTAQSLLTQ